MTLELLNRTTSTEVRPAHGVRRVERTMTATLRSVVIVPSEDRQDAEDLAAALEDLEKYAAEPWDRYPTLDDYLGR